MRQKDHRAHKKHNHRHHHRRHSSKEVEQQQQQSEITVKEEKPTDCEIFAELPVFIDEFEELLKEGIVCHLDDTPPLINFQTAFAAMCKENPYRAFLSGKLKTFLTPMGCIKMLERSGVSCPYTEKQLSNASVCYFFMYDSWCVDDSALISAGSGYDPCAIEILIAAEKLNRFESSDGWFILKEVEESLHCISDFILNHRGRCISTSSDVLNHEALRAQLGFDLVLDFSENLVFSAVSCVLARQKPSAMILANIERCSCEFFRKLIPFLDVSTVCLHVSDSFDSTAVMQSELMRQFKRVKPDIAFHRVGQDGSICSPHFIDALSLGGDARGVIVQVLNLKGFFETFRQTWNRKLPEKDKLSSFMCCWGESGETENLRQDLFKKKNNLVPLRSYEASLDPAKGIVIRDRHDPTLFHAVALGVDVRFKNESEGVFSFVGMKNIQVFKTRVDRLWLYVAQDIPIGTLTKIAKFNTRKGLNFFLAAGVRVLE